MRRRRARSVDVGMGILVAEPEGEVTTAGEQEDRVTDGEVRGREAGRPVEVNPFWSEKARAEAELQAHRLAKVIIREHIEDGLQKLIKKSRMIEIEGILHKLSKLMEGGESSYEGHGEATDAGLPHDPEDGDGKGTIAEKDR
ncbi:unnamed protein product, partial [Effrenium voratum]